MEISASGGGAPSPAPSPPLPKGDSFVRCSGKHPLCTGGKIFFLDTKAKTRHHVPHCLTCPNTGVNTCSPVATVSAAALAATKAGDEFSCAMLGPPGPPPAAKRPWTAPVTGPGGVTIASIRGEFVYTSAELVGNFSCSDEDLNRERDRFSASFVPPPLLSVSLLDAGIHGMILPAMKSNLQGIFTDCPHRERLGWLEQSWLLAKSVGHNFDLSTLYAKIADDMAEAQTPDGMVPDIAPEYVKFAGGFRDSP